MNKIHIVVYGAEQICPGCVGAPDAKDTFEWTEELFYPVVFVNNEIVAEGIPTLKTIYKKLNEYNVTLRS